MAAIAECNRISCSRWLSIQSSPALATPVDLHCVSLESRRFDATRTLVPSIHSRTRASLPSTPQTRRTLSTGTPDERSRSTLASATGSAKQPLRRELLPEDVVAPEPPSFFVSHRACVAFEQGAPAFVVLGRLLPAKGPPSGPCAKGECFAEVQREERFAEVQRRELPGDL